MNVKVVQYCNEKFHNQTYIYDHMQPEKLFHMFNNVLKNDSLTMIP